MQLNEAIVLVRETYLEEQKGVVNGSKAQRYRRALQDYPVTLATALHIWAAGTMRQGGSGAGGKR